MSLTYEPSSKQVGREQVLQLHQQPLRATADAWDKMTGTSFALPGPFSRVPPRLLDAG